jgi:hypothetical protein
MPSIFTSGTYIISEELMYSSSIYQDSIFVICNTSLAPVNIILPSVDETKSFSNFILISDASESASTNNITISTAVGQTINNASSIVINVDGGSCLCLVSSSSLNQIGGQPITSKWVALQSNQSGADGYYGSFYDTTIQIANGVDTVDAIQLNSTDSSATNGISIVNDTFGNPTEITVTKTSTYNIQFSAQLNRIGGGALRQTSIWLRKNGVDVPNTNTHISVQTNSNKVVAAWNFVISLNAGDNVQLMWSVQDIDIELLYEPQNLLVPHPATPSVILTITEV